MTAWAYYTVNANTTAEYTDSNVYFTNDMNTGGGAAATAVLESVLQV